MQSDVDQARRFLFVSHANPEDNQFALWLSLRLATEGYPIWCDLTKLLGGEPFWTHIETAIRTGTAKFLYVLSRTSNEKEGPRRELQVAQNTARDHNLEDFILPLSIDDLPPREINIQLTNLNVMPFQLWETGLDRLLRKLAASGVKKHQRFSPTAVATWWNQQRPDQPRVNHSPETYVTNWLPVTQLPQHIHRSTAPATRERTELWRLTYPATRIGDELFSFAQPDDTRTEAQHHKTHNTADLLKAGATNPTVTPEQAQRGIAQLLNIAWERNAHARGLRTHHLANKHTALYFTAGQAKNRTLRFRTNTGRKTWRTVVGQFRGHIYHFAITGRARVTPSPIISVRPHVLFSDDGQHLWKSNERLASARRTACKTWWNAEWRDRLLATLNYLADGSNHIRLPLEPEGTATIPTMPIQLSSPVSYDEPTEPEILIEPPDEDEFDQ